MDEDQFYTEKNIFNIDFQKALEEAKFEDDEMPVTYQQRGDALKDVVLKYVDNLKVTLLQPKTQLCTTTVFCLK